jgi:hypothetical protein
MSNVSVHGINMKFTKSRTKRRLWETRLGFYCEVLDEMYRCRISQGIKKSLRSVLRKAHLQQYL